MFKDEAFFSGKNRNNLRVTDHFEPFKKLFPKSPSKL